MDFFGQNVHFDGPLDESPPIGEALNTGIAAAAQAIAIPSEGGQTGGDVGGHSGSISIHLEAEGHVKTTGPGLPVPDAFVICQAVNQAFNNTTTSQIA